MNALARASLAFAATSAITLSTAASAPQESTSLDTSGIAWIEGPATGKLGSIATIQVPDGFVFAESAGARRFLELTHNVPGGTELGLILPKDPGESEGWFIVFDYADVGYVKDDEKDELDADDLLDTLQEGTEVGNAERKKRGWPTIELVGWQRPPFYDPKTNNLTWATLGRGEGGESVNWSTRLLGRTGYMNVDLVLGKDDVGAVVPRFEELMRGFDYVGGQRYAEFKAGDKIAEYGLAALVAGGAGVVALKSGFFSKFAKFIVLGLVALATQVKRLFGWIGGRSNADRAADTTKVDA